MFFKQIKGEKSITPPDKGSYRAVQPCLCLANSLWRILDAADGLVHGCPENNFDFSCFLAPLPASYSLGNTKSKSSNPPASPFSFYLFLLNGTRRLQSAI